ncbi:hypothetical protein ARMGADRAFT_1126953 [Armillaria gallica]|uniref:DUF6534 domain-containing protein n=1 Tax=Armillaria gallica TaxID=47427 RepID=A0A2H3CTY8_ARMGA|nr:hypothetical protein ARMGADRAFT_1126953 [Armillaria gallica]
MPIQIVASLLHWGLFGTLSVQLYLYYLAFLNNKKFVKYLVYGIYIVKLVQTILASHDVFATFGYGFGDLDALTDIHFYWLIVPIMSAMIACVRQVFYAYRIFKVSNPAHLLQVSLTSFVAGIIGGVYGFQAGNITKLNNRKISTTFIWCGGSALCDIIIAICMTYYLMHNSTSFRQTRIIVTKLIHLIIETGSVTGMYSLHFTVVRRSALSTFSCCHSTQPYPLLCLPWPDILCDTCFHHIQAICY